MLVKRLLVLSLAIFSILTVRAASPVLVKASLDSATLLMGQTTRLHLQVEKGKDIAGHFPLFTDNDSRPYATLLGDTIELSKKFTTDTVNLADGLMRINYHVPVQVFDSGYYQLPPFQYVAGQDTILSNSVSLNVVPVKAAATDKISDLTDVADPAPGNWTDKIPDWLLEYWWAILAGLILIAALTYLIIYWLKHRKKSPVHKVVIIPPYEEAMRALVELKRKELWQQGDSEHYFVELTKILRRYLSRRFGVSAPEMTTTQFLEEVSKNSALSAYKSELRRLLQLADFIKFAKGQALPDENEEAYDIVVKFVEMTRPAKEDEEAANQNRKEAKK